MKRILLLLTVIGFLCSPGWAQSGGFSTGRGANITHFPGVPSGSCTRSQLAENDATGDFYDCLVGVWFKIGPGSASTVAFSGITSATNTTAAMVCGTGCSIATSGSGTNVATKAAIWTTARLLAGNSVDGSANVAFANAFIVQGTADSGLSGAQFLGALATGVVKNTTSTGVLSIAVAADIYGLWSGTKDSSHCLAGDGTMQSCAGGGGSPGGSTTQLQYNNAAAFGGTAGLTWSSANQALALATGAITTDINPFALTWTYNAAGTTFNGHKETLTNTASHAGSLGWQWCVGATCTTIDTSGNMVIPGNITFGGSNLQINTGGTQQGFVSIGGGTSLAPYQLFQDSASGHKSYFTGDPTVAGRVCVGTAVPGADCTTQSAAGTALFGGAELLKLNAASTGTTLNKLAKLAGTTDTVVIATTSDTAIPLFLVVAGAGTSGNAILQLDGEAPCIFDGATIALDFVVASTTTGGDCHDTGSPVAPTSGWVVGQVTSTNGSGGTYTVQISPGYNASAGGGSSSQAILGLVANGPVDFGNTTYYIGVTGNAANGTVYATTESPVQIVWPVACTAKNLWLQTSGGAGSNRVITLRQNGADTTLTVSVAQNTTGGDTTHSVSLAAGDLVNLSTTATSATAAQFKSFSMTCQ